MQTAESTKQPQEARLRSGDPRSTQRLAQVIWRTGPNKASATSKGFQKRHLPMPRSGVSGVKEAA